MSTRVGGLVGGYVHQASTTHTEADRAAIEWALGAPATLTWRASAQTGGALGTSVPISLISGGVGSALTGEPAAAGVTAPMAQGLGETKDAVAMGISPVDAPTPSPPRSAVIEGPARRW
ncbi:hypothetical protein [Streptomyces sp. NPDC060333]|uniref:hypothetical protein n=1 Tax=Streptomyces sp. NPDC060333 TaxID=3347098 RepID=UPI00364F8760